MSVGLSIAAALLAAIALAHSVLGERYILVRLFRRGPLPKLFGSDWFTRRTLRFAWHLTSVAWLGFAALLLFLAGGAPPGREVVLGVVALTFLATGVIALVASRGKHFAWPVFLAI
ncbi:MAG: hypothetical protein GY769_20325 [bacterium]|nr:hypothetical protein [bacterium]